mmetsp:Transcript_16062/g.40442  ORF Transcript_16062/g.40442 Transcript_16062/m.40442 type:complete len:363 (-) Transcript_16062:3-1091(-)
MQLVLLEKVLLRPDYAPRPTQPDVTYRLFRRETRVPDHVARDQCARPPQSCQAVDRHHALRRVANVQEPVYHIHGGHSAVWELEDVVLNAHMVRKLLIVVEQILVEAHHIRHPEPLEGLSVVGRPPRDGVGLVRPFPGAGKGDKLGGDAAYVVVRLLVHVLPPSHVKVVSVKPAQRHGPVQPPQAVEDRQAKSGRLPRGVAEGLNGEAKDAVKARGRLLRGEIVLEHQVAGQQEGRVGEVVGLGRGVENQATGLQLRVLHLLPHLQAEAHDHFELNGPKVVAERDIGLGDDRTEEEECRELGDDFRCPCLGFVRREEDSVGGKVIDPLRVIRRVVPGWNHRRVRANCRTGILYLNTPLCKLE